MNGLDQLNKRHFIKIDCQSLKFLRMRIKGKTGYTLAIAQTKEFVRDNNHALLSATALNKTLQNADSLD